MRSSRTSSLNRVPNERDIVNGFIVIWKENGLPALEARRMIRLDEGLHYRSTRETEDGRVYRLAEDFFIHQLPANIRLKEILNAERYHHQMMLARISEDLEQTDLIIEQARKEDK